MTTRQVDFPDGLTSDTTPTVSGSSWGGISGTLSNQTDLQAALDAKASATDLANHLSDAVDAHDASAISNVPSGNLAATTVQAALDELQTDVDTRATSASVTSSLAGKQDLDSDLTALAGVSATGLLARTGSGTASARTLTGTANQLTVTNGDGVAGNPTVSIPSTGLVIPGTAAVQVPAGTTAQRPSGVNSMFRYNSDTGNFEGYAAGAWGSIAGSGGGINYISAPDGASIGAWVTYADAAGTSPVDGTGGSPVSTFAVSTDSSLAGTTNFIFTKGAANRQGEGFSVPFSIDDGYQAKPLKITALYKIASGSFVDNDMSVWVYDVTNSTLIACTPQFIKNSTGVEQISAEFQSAYNSTSYRLIFHVGSTSASAYTLRFDSFSVSPTVFIAGASVSEFVQDTGFTYAGLGTVTTNNVWTRRVGDSLEIRGFVTPGTPAASTFSIILPSRYRIDTAKLSSSHQRLGYIERLNSTASTFATANYGPFPVFYDGSTNDRLFAANTSASSTTYTKSNGDNILSAAGNSGSFVVTIPIAGFGTSQILSSETDTRRVSCTYYGSTGTRSVDTSNPLRFETKYEDTHNFGTGGSGGFSATIPVPGQYDITFVAGMTAGPKEVYLYKNGSNVYGSAIPIGVSASSGTHLLTYAFSGVFVAGDVIDVRTEASVTQASTTGNRITITRISGPAQIAASETITASYYVSGATLAVGANSQIDFDTKLFDSHGAVTTGSSWKFTAPVSGTYSIAPTSLYSSGTASRLVVYKNGSSYCNFGVMGTAGGQQSYVSGKVEIKLLAGETADARVTNATTLGGSSAPYDTFISITKVGNY